MADDSEKLSKPKAFSNSFAQENWIELWNFFKHKPDLVISNPEIAQAIINYENNFFSNLDNELNEVGIFSDLETFYILHKRKSHILSSERFQITVNRLVAFLRKSNLHKAYKLAINCRADDLCQTVINEYESTIPKIISHSQSKIVKIVENQNLNKTDGRRSLFKSTQEKDFFDAVREVYPQHIVYPNVALSSTLNFETIKNFLSDVEKKYFFVAVIDCVVFDYDHLYMPKYFFEIDSLYHDDSAQITKDSYKNNIFSAAGQKLYRIRKVGSYQGRVDFIKLIREILSPTN